MKVKKTKSGRVMIQATLGTLEVGQMWKVSPDAYSLRYIRTAVSLYASAVNKSFTVNAPDPYVKNDSIRITRTR